MKICPYCESEISDTAKKCKYCGEWVVTMENPFRKGDKKIQPTETKNKEENNKEKKVKIESKRTIDSTTKGINTTDFRDTNFKTHVFDDDDDNESNEELENNFNKKNNQDNTKNKGKNWEINDKGEESEESISNNGQDNGNNEDSTENKGENTNDKKINRATITIIIIAMIFSIVILIYRISLINNGGNNSKTNQQTIMIDNDSQENSNKKNNLNDNDNGKGKKEGQNEKNDCLSYTGSKAGFNGLVITKFNCKETNVVIPNEIQGKTITEIGKSAFKNKNITNIELPSGLKQISNSAFAYNSLEEIEIPEGVEIIEDQAFKDNLIKSISFPKSLKTIGKEAFEKNNLTGFTVPGRLNKVGESAFCNNQNNPVIGISENLEWYFSGACFNLIMETNVVEDGKGTTNKINNNMTKKNAKPSCGKRPGTVYRSEDGWCACPGDPIGKSSWNEDTRSCSKSNSNNNTEKQQQNNNYVDCNDPAVMLACSIGGDTCPTKCYNYINSSTKNEIQQELSNSLNQVNECNDPAVMLACSFGSDSCPRACRN